MGLFKPGWMSRDEGKALRSLDKISRDEELYRIVLECPHGSVRMRALSRIRDAGRRLDLVLTAQAVSFDERLAALEGATEEGLCRAAREAPSCDIRLEAVGRMTDSLLLAELVKEGAGGSRDDRRVCEAAYEKMTRGVNKRVEMETVLIRICGIPDSGISAQTSQQPSQSPRHSQPDQSTMIHSLLSRIEALERTVRSGALQGRPSAQSTIPILGSTSDPGGKGNSDKGGASVNVRELSDTARAYGEWNRVIEVLEGVNQAAYSVLANSRAFINGKYLLIETGAFGRDMLRNSQVKDAIRGIVRQISGIDCRLGPYTPSGAVQINHAEQNAPSNESTVAAAEKIMQRAQQAGIDVEEN